MKCKWCGDYMRIERVDGHADCVERILYEEDIRTSPNVMLKMLLAIGEDSGDGHKEPEVLTLQEKGKSGAS